MAKDNSTVEDLINRAQKITRKKCLSNLGTHLNEVNECSEFFEISFQGSKSIMLMPVSALENAPISYNVGSKDLKTKASGKEGSSSRVFQDVLDGKVVAVTRHRQVAAILVEKEEALRIAKGIPNHQKSKNQEHFDKIVKMAMDQNNDIEITLDPDGKIRASIKPSDLNNLRKTMESFNLTPEQVIEIIGDNAPDIK